MPTVKRDTQVSARSWLSLVLSVVYVVDINVISAQGLFGLFAVSSGLTFGDKR